MSSYLDDYGVRDARREHILKRIVIAVVVIAAVSGLLYWKFKDYREERQISTFFDLIHKQDYKAAYAMWGCTEEKPCRQYSFEKFMEDWGPGKSGKAVSMKVGETHACASGLIQTVNVGDEEVWLWVNRSDHVLSFAPWPVCNPHLPPDAAKSPTG